MDFLKTQLNRIQEQLGGLNASQKMLTGALVAIMVMTLLWWGRYAGEPEMAPVLDQSFGAEDITQVTSHLAAKGIKYQVVGDKVMVPADRKFEALAGLSYARLLPRDIKTGFDEMVKQMNPWQPASTTDKMWNKANEMTLAQIIRNFPNVNNAMVIIDPTRTRTIGSAIEPTATVNITMRQGEKPGKQLINAAADVVAGAQAGLARGKVIVVVDGVSYPVLDHNNEFNQGGMSGEAIDQIQTFERYYSEKILKQLEFINGVMVSVTVDLNRKYTEEKKRTYDQRNSMTKEKQINTENDDTQTIAPPSSEPGVTANVGLQIAGGGGGGTSTNHEKTETTLETFPSVSDTIVRTPGGDAPVVAASVGVPRSYFVSVYKNSTPNAKDPDDVMLQPLIDREMPKIRKHVKGCTGLKNDTDVTVETYADVVPLMAIASDNGGSSSVKTVLNNYTKQIGVVALAVVSLFMVMMMVRKGAPAVSVVAMPEPKIANRLEGGEELAGEVSEGNPTLDGMELDEDAVKAQQMIDQVSTMVKENPDAAANLVKRWLNRA